jgi:hypothetical protein
VINANAGEHKDLFHVLKGGSGANFGIVTKFEVQAFEASNLWGGTLVYPKSVGQQHVKAYQAWTENLNNYPEGSSIIFWSHLPAVQDIVILAAYEDTDGNEAPPGFDEFNDENRESQGADRRARAGYRLSVGCIVSHSNVGY